MKRLQDHLTESLKLRKKLCFLSSFIFKEISPIREFNQLAMNHIEEELILNVLLIESDKTLSEFEKLKSKTMTQELIRRKRIVAEAQTHIEEASLWAHRIKVDKR